MAGQHRVNHVGHGVDKTDVDVLSQVIGQFFHIGPVPCGHEHES